MAHAIPLLCEQPLGFKPKPQQFSESAVQHSTHRATRVLQRWGIQNLTWQIPDHSNNCSILTITKTRTTYKTTYFFCFKDLVQQTIWTEQAGVQTEPVHILLINVCSVLCDCVIAVLYINNMQWHCQSLYWAGTRFNRPLLQTKPSDIHSCFPFQMVWWTLPTDLICKLFEQYKALFVVFDHLPLVLAANLMASSGTLDLQLGVWYTISCVAMWSSLVTYTLCKLFLQIQISYSCIDSLWNTYWPQLHNLMPTFLGMLKRAKLSGCTIASTTTVAAMVTNSSIKSKIYITQSKLMICILTILQEPGTIEAQTSNIICWGSYCEKKKTCQYRVQSSAVGVYWHYSSFLFEVYPAIIRELTVTPCLSLYMPCPIL